MVEAAVVLLVPVLVPVVFLVLLLVTSTTTTIESECRSEHILVSTVVMNAVDTSAHSFAASVVSHRAICSHTPDPEAREVQDPHHT